MYITSTRGANAVSHDGVQYQPLQGFVFDVPFELAQHLLTMRDQFGPLFRLPEQDDYDLDEPIAAPGPDRPEPAAPKKTAARKPRGAAGGVPPVKPE